MLLFIDKVTTGTQSLGLFFWNVASMAGADGLAFGLPVASGVPNISDIAALPTSNKALFCS